MKLAFIDLYSEGASHHKDPVTTPLSLKARGHEVELVSCDPAVAERFEIAGLPVVPASQLTGRGWGSQNFDAVIALSRFAAPLTPLLTEVKAAGLPLIVKGDTDGTLGYPLKPNYLRIVPVLAHPSNILRQLKWRLPVRHWVGQKMAHFALADRVVVESPGAVANLRQVLLYWGFTSDLGKIHFIPNQVSQLALDVPVGSHRDKTILAIGRWNDALCKGADLLAGTVTDLFKLRDDYEVIVVGTGLDEIRKRLPEHATTRVSLCDELSFAALQQLLVRARILVAPSRVESFSFVAAEALCGGASIVVTPIESLTYLAGGGAWGTVAKGFSTGSVTAALLSEMDRWDNGAHDPQQIAAFWRSRLSPATVTDLWLNLLEGIQADSQGRERLERQP